MALSDYDRGLSDGTIQTWETVIEMFERMGEGLPESGVTPNILLSDWTAESIEAIKKTIREVKALSARV